jgi:hypothetical protein
MSKRIGVVVATHPEDHSVDLVMTDDGARLTGVQVMTPNGSNRSGSVDLPHITPNGDKWDITQRNKDQDMIAVVDFVGKIPLVHGFVFPQISQMTFSDPKLKINRHQSDVYSAIDGDGNVEFYHPSGAYIRIGEAPDHVDLNSKNVDKSFATDRNTGKRVNIRVATGGNTVVFTMTPDGEVSFKLEQDFKIEAQGNFSLEAQGNISLKAGGTLSTESGGATTIKAPTITEDGNTTVTQNFNVDGSTTVKAITSNGKDISSTHKHLGVLSGPAQTGVPV